MSKKKSLGSSPIGYSSLGFDSFEFIPTITVSQPSQEESAPIGSGNSDGFDDTKSSSHNDKKEHVNKQIVSYYLEETLVERIKKVADDQKIYYSTLVSRALSYWLKNGNTQ